MGTEARIAHSQSACKRPFEWLAELERCGHTTGHRVYAQWRPCHLRPTREESIEACRVVLVASAKKTQSGACSAYPVGRVETPARAFAQRIGRYATWVLSVRSRHASQQHCSAGDVEEESLPDWA